MFDVQVTATQAGCCKLTERNGPEMPKSKPTQAINDKAKFNGNLGKYLWGFVQSYHLDAMWAMHPIDQ